MKSIYEIPETSVGIWILRKVRILWHHRGSYRKQGWEYDVSNALQ